MPEMDPLLTKAEILEAILANLSDHIYVYDQQGVYLYASTSGARALGLKTSDIIGKTWQELGFPSEIMARFDVHRETVFKTHLPVKGHTSFPTLVGLRNYAYVIKPLFDQQAGVQAAVCVCRDVTDISHAEDWWELLGDTIESVPLQPTEEDGELRLSLLREHKSEQYLWETEGQLRIVADALPGLIAYVDVQQRYRFNNRGYWDWFGQSPQEMYGRHIKEILGNAAYGVIRPHAEAALAGHTVRFEQTLPYQRAGNRHVSVCYIPDCAASGKIRGFFAVVQDITAVKKRREMERKHLLELSHAARLATMGEMVTEIAHEINQPLAAIANYSMACLRVVQSGQALHQMVNWLENINVQTKRASQIVHRVRSFVSKRQISPTLIDMSELVKKVVDFTKIEAHAYGVTVIITCSETPCWVSADKVLIEQVIVNLIRNAIEAMAGMDSRERQLWIRTTCREAEVTVSVGDNGPGIPPELGERIFEAFITSKADGLGMGLAISRSIVEVNGGKLWVLSPREGGATFTFTLPFAEGNGNGISDTTHSLHCR